MYVIVVGAGRVGIPLAGWLVSAGHEIAVIDIDLARCAAIDESLGSVSVPGDGSDADVLAKAGVSRADALIATTRMDDVNLVACQVAKHHYGVSKSISVVNSRDHTELFGASGIDVAIDVNELVLGRIQQGLASEGLAHLMPVSIRESKALVAIKVPPESGAGGRPVKDISLPDGTFISLVITRDGNALVPNESTVIRAGDEVIAVTTAHEEEALRDLLVQRPGE